MPRDVARIRSLVGLAAGLIFAAAGCGATSASAGTSGSAGSCASLTLSQERSAASLIFVGVALPGPTVTDSGHQVLASPAHFRVEHYIKGSGPNVVAVQTAASSGTTSEDGITPEAGQRWVIYTTSSRDPYATNICMGSAAENR